MRVSNTHTHTHTHKHFTTNTFPLPVQRTRKLQPGSIVTGNIACLFAANDQQPKTSRMQHPVLLFFPPMWRSSPKPVTRQAAERPRDCPPTSYVRKAWFPSRLCDEKRIAELDFLGGGRNKLCTIVCRPLDAQYPSRATPFPSRNSRSSI